MKKLPLRDGKFAVVDDKDFEVCRHYRWYLLFRKNKSKTEYAQTTYKEKGKWRMISLHRFLMKPPAGFHVDHINFDGLDCRRINMRIVSPKENAQHRRPEISSPLTNRIYTPWHKRIGKHANFAAFFRKALEDRKLTVKRAWLQVQPISIHIIYNWLSGQRLPMAWQLKLIEERFKFNTPYEILYYKKWGMARNREKGIAA